MSDENNSLKKSHPLAGWFQTRMIGWLVRVTPGCNEVTRLLSKSMETRLPWMIRIRLRLHFIFCDLCLRYRNQLRALRLFSRVFPDRTEAASSETLSALAKERIKSRLRSEKNEQEK